MADDKKFSEWHGIPRDKIKWNPAVDKSKCIGCGMCITGCGRNVYDWDSKEGKPVVARPNNCMVGCVTCSNTCLFSAISFPDKEELRKIIVESGAVTGELLDDDKRGLGYGGLSTANGIGDFVSSIVVSSLWSVFGFASGFAFSAVVGLIGTLTLLWTSSLDKN